MPVFVDAMPQQIEQGVSVSHRISSSTNIYSISPQLGPFRCLALAFLEALVFPTTGLKQNHRAVNKQERLIDITG
jgi:hypothetical protein